MKKSFFLILLGLSSLIYAQNKNEFTDLYGDYLGQIAPGDTPVVFAPGFISRKGLEYGPAIFSKDGNAVYWCGRVADSQEGKIYTWCMKRINKRWTKPEVFVPFADSVCFDPFLSNDGKRLYFGADGDAGNTDIWFVEKQGGGWGRPQSISPVVNTINGQCQATLTSDGTVYYIDYKTVNNKWTCDILRSRFKNGNYLQPETLPVSINSSSEDWTPYIAWDDSYLIFSSTRNNYGDLYISFHDIPTDTWSEPINMGGLINTATQETYPTVSPDGKYLFFTRYTNEKSSMDVYWVSAKIIDRLRKNSMKK